MKSFKKAMRMLLLVLLIVLASVGVGLGTGVPPPISHRKDTEAEFKIELVENKEDEEEVNEVDFKN